MIFDGFAAQVSKASRLSAKASAPLSVKVRTSSSTSSNADSTSRTGVKCTALTSKSASNNLNRSEQLQLNSRVVWIRCEVSYTKRN